MAYQTIPGSEELAKQIKSRRKELGLTIEDAASRAGVGTKTWCRYEAGESIRKDKCKGICKALNWHSWLDKEFSDNDTLTIEEFKSHKAWSTFLENMFSEEAAFSFAAGSDILLDHINGDIAELALKPSGTHIGQLQISWLRGDLPEQFLMQYNYEFLYQMKCTLLNMRMRAENGFDMTAHSVMEELVLYLCHEEASTLIELCGGIIKTDLSVAIDQSEWVFDLFDDMDIISFLYSDAYIDENHTYHFSHWADQQFYMDRP